MRARTPLGRWAAGWCWVGWLCAALLVTSAFAPRPPLPGGRSLQRLEAGLHTETFIKRRQILYDKLEKKRAKYKALKEELRVAYAEIAALQSLAQESAEANQSRESDFRAEFQQFEKMKIFNNKQFDTM